jgi:hypothetical protein
MLIVKVVQVKNNFRLGQRLLKLQFRTPSFEEQNYKSCEVRNQPENDEE